MKKNKLAQKMRLDDLLIDDLKLFQHPDYFCFSIDAVLLTDFAQPSPGAKVLDLGTGTGVIPHLIQAKYDISEVYGIDVQPEVIKMARKSVKYNQLEEKLNFFQLDLRKALVFFGSEKFDYIVSNPPYLKINNGKINSNEKEAIARAEVKCTLEDIIRTSNQLVKYGGKAAYVYRTQRLAELLSLMEEYNLACKRMRLVYSQKEEPAKLVLVEGVKGGGSGLKVYPPLIIYNSKGEYTEEINKIYYPERD